MALSDQRRVERTGLENEDKEEQDARHAEAWFAHFQPAVTPRNVLLKHTEECRRDSGLIAALGLNKDNLKPGAACETYLEFAKTWSQDWDLKVHNHERQILILNSMKKNPNTTVVIFVHHDGRARFFSR